MATPEREARLVSVARMYCRGVSQRRMADTLEVSKKQIQNDVAELLRRWGKEQQESVRVKAIAKLEHLEDTLWIAWEESQKDRTKTKKASRSGDRGRSNSEETQTERRDPNPAFTDQIIKVRALLGKIQGIIVDKVARTNARGEDAAPLRDEKKAAALKGILDRLGAGRNGTNGEQKN